LGMRQDGSPLGRHPDAYAINVLIMKHFTLGL